MRKNILGLLVLSCVFEVFAACSSTDNAKPGEPAKRSQAKASSDKTEGTEDSLEVTLSDDGDASSTYASDASIAGDSAVDDSKPDGGLYGSSGEASVVTRSNTDGGLVESRGCCEPHAGAGCEDRAIEACVCAPDVLPDCCTKGWDVFCVEVVRQRYCDPGIRQCVCEQWQQEGCCSVKWTDTFCELTAELKCSSVVGCGNQ